MQKISDLWARYNDSARNKDMQQPVDRAVLIGAPDDRGVKNVGGRLGAALGPSAVRAALEKMMLGIHGEAFSLNPGSDIELGKTIEQAHENLARTVERSFRAGAAPIVLGGGHDFGYPHFLGIKRAIEQPVALINIDAHLDVRPRNDLGITSGSPFYLALESGALDPKLFFEFGIQTHCNSKSALEYVTAKGVNVQMLGELRNSKLGVIGEYKKILAALSAKNIPLVVSFDLDAVSMAWSPGVSAAQTDGFTSHELLEMVRLAAKFRNVASIGFFEFAPALDEQNKTAKLAATAIHRFCEELIFRESSKQGRGGKKRLRHLLRAPKDRRGL